MKKVLWILGLLALCLVSLFVGVHDIAPLDLLRDPEKMNVFLLSRLPRLVSILVVGAGMAVSGVVMQSITANRFVSPTTAGTMDFCKLGVLLSWFLLPGPGIVWQMLFAFAFSLLGTWIFMFIIGRVQLKDAIFIPLVGIMLGGVVTSISTFIGYQFDLIQNINSWLQGRFTLIIRGRYELVLIALPVLVAMYLYADRFTIAGMGEGFSENLGLRHKTIVNTGLVLCSLICAAVMVTVGNIPFIGVIVPNLVSLYKGDNLRRTLPLTAIAGAVFLLVCDVLGRLVIYPKEIPVGVTTGTIGSAIFIYLILRKQRHAKKAS